MLVTKRQLLSLRTQKEISARLLMEIYQLTEGKKRTLIHNGQIKEMHYEVQPIELEHFKIQIQGM